MVIVSTLPARTKLPLRGVMARLGYRGAAPKPETRRRIERIVREAGTYIDPSSFYRFVATRDISPQTVTLEGAWVLRSEKISYALSECHSVVVFAVTIGPRLERQIGSYTASGDTFQAFVMDACGSTAAEELANQLSRDISKLVRDDHKKTTLRYSPGYCDWSLEEQDTIFSLLACDEMTITLSDSKVMTPLKSISGIIGVTDARNRILSPCANCELRTTCAYRRLSR